MSPIRCKNDLKHRARCTYIKKTNHQKINKKKIDPFVNEEQLLNRKGGVREKI